MRRCIVYLAKGEVEEYFKQITSELALNFSERNLSERVPAHITLKYPFETEDVNLIENKIADVLKNKSKVLFKVGGFERFENSKETIFLSVNH
ncbi:MAG: 2'-5' RNA ligase family protein [bacterium]